MGASRIARRQPCPAMATMGGHEQHLALPCRCHQHLTLLLITPSSSTVSATIQARLLHRPLTILPKPSPSCARTHGVRPALRAASQAHAARAQQRFHETYRHHQPSKRERS